MGAEAGTSSHTSGQRQSQSPSGTLFVPLLALYFAFHDQTILLFKQYKWRIAQVIEIIHWYDYNLQFFSYLSI